MSGVIAAYPMPGKTIKVLTKSPKNLSEKKIKYAFRKRKTNKLISIENLSEEADDANN